MLPYILACLALGCGLDVANGEYSPVLTWDVCSPSRISVTLSGAADGGIIYIKGYGAACKQTTTTTPTAHEFDFNACGINTAETYFTMIVQKNPLYQTGADLQESLLCIYDLSDISVNNAVNVGDKADDAGINKTVKPTAQMKLYSDGLDIGGDSVKLTDLVTMTIQVDDEFIADFDIKAISCTANFIDIISNHCAADTELFPGFTHVTRGVITATFGAFRTTDLGSGLVQMVFSCTVQVCLDACAVSACDTGSTGSTGSGRRKRAVESATYDEVNVGASMAVGERVEVKTNGPRVTGEICLNTIAFVVALTLLVAVVMTSMAMTSYSTTKLVRKSNQLRKYMGQDKTGSPRKQQQHNVTMGDPGTQKRKLSTVSVISTHSSSPMPTITTNETSRTKSCKPVNTPPSGRKASLYKQASVSTMFSPHTVNHSSKRSETQALNQSGDSREMHVTSGQIGCQDERKLSGSRKDCATISNMRAPNKEQLSKLDELKAAQNELLHYKTLLEQVGIAHLMHES